VATRLHVHASLHVAGTESKHKQAAAPAPAPHLGRHARRRLPLLLQLRAPLRSLLVLLPLQALYHVCNALAAEQHRLGAAAAQAAAAAARAFVCAAGLGLGLALAGCLGVGGGPRAILLLLLLLL
jgi:hypothetical protein